MAKLKNVTHEEIRALIETNDGTASDLANRIEKGYIEELESPAELAMSLLAFGMSISDCASKILMRAFLAEQRRGFPTP